MRHITENEKLDSFKSVFLGNYLLKLINNKNPFGSIYLDNINDWNDLKNKNIYLNFLDENFFNSLEKLKEVIIENFLKKNFIIMRLESNNSSVSFYINNLPHIINKEYSIVKILINNIDFIDSTGVPEYNEKYKLSYILNDSSKETNITNTSTTNIPSKISNIFSLETSVKIPEGNIISKSIYAKNPDTPPGVADYKKDIIVRKHNDAVLIKKYKYNNLKKQLRYDRIITVIIIIIIIFISIKSLYFS